MTPAGRAGHLAAAPAAHTALVRPHGQAQAAEDSLHNLDTGHGQNSRCCTMPKLEREVVRERAVHCERLETGHDTAAELGLRQWKLDRATDECRRILGGCSCQVSHMGFHSLGKLAKALLGDALEEAAAEAEEAAKLMRSLMYAAAAAAGSQSCILDLQEADKTMLAAVVVVVVVVVVFGRRV